LIQGDLTGYGGNFAPVDRSRNVYGIFGEVSAPVIKDVELNGALRFDDFGDAGSKVTPKVSARWNVAPGVLARASYGKGFRAPSLLDLNAPQTTGVTPAGVSDPLRCPVTDSTLDCFTQFPVTNGGSTSLKAEESTNITAGLIFEPTRNSSIGVEYFNIKLENTISNGFDAFTILGDLSKYGNLVRRGPVQPTFPTLPGPIVNIDQINLNSGETKLSGIDLDMRWRGEATAYGRFSASFSGTYFDRFESQNPDGSFSSEIDVVGAAGGVITRWRSYTTVGWQAGKWNLTFAQNYQPGYNDLPGTFEDTSDPAFKPRRVGKYVTYDAQAAWQFNRAMLLTLGVRNLTDQEPPYSNAGGQTSFQSGYDPTYGDPRGRFFYGRVNYKFF
jgi:iron complex outermembrane recepter protein